MRYDVSIHTSLIDSILGEAMASYGPLLYGQYYGLLYLRNVDNELLLLSRFAIKSPLFFFHYISYNKMYNFIKKFIVFSISNLGIT